MKQDIESVAGEKSRGALEQTFYEDQLEHGLSDCLENNPPALSLVISEMRQKYQPGRNPVEKSFRLVRFVLVKFARLDKAIRVARRNESNNRR